jgi:4-amino-4-deoxy-L-arabinose transferase-like glycosyltransferase
MPVAAAHSSRGITLPPRGWVLALLLFVYIFTGLVGHDPWKHDDAVSIGIAWDIAKNGNWLVLQLAGQPYPDAPLYYWAAAITTQFFSWLLPAHDAARLASGVFTLLALEFILLAARELHGRSEAPAAPMLLAGSIGFLFHAHEAQPMLAALTAHTAAYWALTLRLRRPRTATIVFGGAIALAFLADGLLPAVTLLPITLAALWLTGDRKRNVVFLLLSTALAALLCALWLLPLKAAAPEYFVSFFQAEWRSLTKGVAPHTNIVRYLNMLLWYAWPALPLAAWALWAKRRVLASAPLALPIASLLGVLAILGFNVETSSTVSLLLLPPLVLLAVPGVASLRRGAANAFDWFGMMTFTLFAAVVWIAWSAMVFGWPERLARQAVRLEPGFVGHFSLIAFLIAALATMTWFWLIATSPRAPMRGTMHWIAGLTLFWLLIAMLWMPWIDYGKSYRGVSGALAKALPAKVDCIADANVSDAILASFQYFDGTLTVPLTSPEAKRCSWLLVHGKPTDPGALTAAGWRPVWQGNRPSDRRDTEEFRLYRRRAKAAAPLVEVNVVGQEGAPAQP